MKEHIILKHHYNIYMSTHTDLVYVYELTKNALDNIKDLERKMTKYDKKKIKKTRRNFGGKRKKKTRKNKMSR